MNKTATQILVIGYGNDLRSDDGIGVRVAQKIAQWDLSNVRSLGVHQLTPELAAEIAVAERVIFVDAYPALSHQAVQVFRLSASDEEMISSHTSNPWALLALTRSLYRCCPTAWWVLIPGTNFELGDRLSPTARRGIAQALNHLLNLIQNEGNQQHSLVHPTA